MLAFFETPSSLSWTSDPRHKPRRISLPCGVTETVELFCLFVLLADLVVKVSHSSVHVTMALAKLSCNFETLFMNDLDRTALVIKLEAAAKIDELCRFQTIGVNMRS